MDSDPKFERRPTDAAKPHPITRLLPSLTDFAFLLPVLFLFVQLNGASYLIGDGDTGWHIRTGDWILANGRVPTHDLFSFTMPGSPWYAWEWLWDVCFAWIHQRMGLAGVAYFSIVVLCFVSALVYRLALRRCGNCVVAIAVTVCVSAGSVMHWLARPHLFTLLFVIIFLHILDRVGGGRTQPLWALPLLMILWTNLHGGFFVGVFLVGCYAAGELIEAVIDGDAGARQAALRRAKPYLLCAAGCVCVTFLNPYTYKLHLHIWNYLAESYHFQNIVEFQSIDFHHGVARFFEPLIILGVVAAIWAVTRRRYIDALLLIATLHLGLIAVRNLPIYLLVSAAPIAELLSRVLELAEGGDWAPWLRRTAGSLQSVGAEFTSMDALPRLHLASLAGCVLLFAGMMSATSGKLLAEYDRKTYPHSAIPVVEKLATQSRLFSTDVWGGFLIYSLYPQARVFIDGRSDFYGSRYGNEYLRVITGKHDWQAILDKYQISAVLLDADSALASAVKLSAGWHIVHDDGIALVAERSHGQSGSAPTSSIANCDGQFHDGRVVANSTGEATLARIPKPANQP